eukprot:g4570.t1
MATTHYGTITGPGVRAGAGAALPSPAGAPRTWQWYVNMLFINMVELGSEGARGLVLPSMYLFQLRLGGSNLFMCYLIAAFSAGRVISSTLLGVMSDRAGCRRTYIVALLISAAGNALYALSDYSCLGSRWALLASRFVIGFGAGNRAVCRADVAAITRPAQRLRWITVLSATIFAGYALTPGLGSLLARVHGRALGVAWNEYNTPGAVLALYNLAVAAAACLAYGSDVGVGDAPAPTAAEQRREREDADARAAQARRRATALSRKVSIQYAVHDAPPRVVAAPGGGGLAHALAGAPPRASLIRRGVWLCIGLNFVSRGILCILETTMAPLFLLAAHESGAAPSAVSDTAQFQLGMGAVGLVTLLVLDAARRRVAELKLLTFAFAATAAGCALLVPNLDNLGRGRFVAAELLAWSIGSPISGAVVIASFSKIIGKGKQGRQMGIIGSAGSLARIIMPLLLGALPGDRPFETEFVILTVLAVLCAGASAYFFALVRAEQGRDRPESWPAAEQRLLSPRNPVSLVAPRG